MTPTISSPPASRDRLLCYGTYHIDWANSRASKLVVKVKVKTARTEDALTLIFPRRDAEALIALANPTGPQPPAHYLMAGWDSDALQRLYRRGMVKLKAQANYPLTMPGFWTYLAAHPDKWELTPGASRTASALQDFLTHFVPWQGIVPLYSMNDDSDRPWSEVAVTKLQKNLAAFGLYGKIMNNVEPPKPSDLRLSGPHVMVGFQASTYWLRWLPSVEERIIDCIMQALPDA